MAKSRIAYEVLNITLMGTTESQANRQIQQAKSADSDEVEEEKGEEKQAKKTTKDGISNAMHQCGPSVVKHNSDLAGCIARKVSLLTLR